MRTQGELGWGGLHTKGVLLSERNTAYMDAVVAVHTAICIIHMQVVVGSILGFVFYSRVICTGARSSGVQQTAIPTYSNQ